MHKYKAFKSILFYDMHHVAQSIYDAMHLNSSRSSSVGRREWGATQERAMGVGASRRIPFLCFISPFLNRHTSLFDSSTSIAPLRRPACFYKMDAGGVIGQALRAHIPKLIPESDATWRSAVSIIVRWTQPVPSARDIPLRGFLKKHAGSLEVLFIHRSSRYVPCA